ncbi:NAD-binding protein [bacterium]|nr:NAD-binding protein [bacterium]
MKIIIVGGTPTALTLANLMGEKNELTIVEQDPDKAKEIANTTSALVVEGDGSDISVLNDAGLVDCDAIVCTSDDKTNLMVCEIAKSENVKKIIALVNKPKNEELFKKLGISKIVSVVGTNVTAIKQVLAEYGDERIICQIGNGKIQIYEETVEKDSPLIDQPLELPGASVAGVYRGGEIIMAKDVVAVNEGDVLIVIAKTEDIPKIKELITGA